ncbi:MAG: hypothetical protein GYA02_02210, partial [Clostridiaceae bacterium]|nr:hypothetical protein [Clostridiaceae bacterium]
MDIKSKKSKAFIIWLCFFIGIGIFTATLTGSIILLKDDYYGFSNVFDYAFKSDVKDTMQFRHTISLKFRLLAETLTQENHEEQLNIAEANLDREGKNLIYYARNLRNGVKLSNTRTDFGSAVKGFPALPDGYDYYLYFDGKKITIEHSGKIVDIYDSDVYNAGYSMLKHWGYLSENIEETNPDLSKCQILLIVKKDIGKVFNQESQLYRIKKDLNALKSVFTSIIIVFLVSCVLILVSILNWKTKKEFDRKIGSFFSKFWIEIKVFAAMIVLVIVALACYRYTPTLVVNLSSLLSIIFVVLIIGWSLYFIFIDFLYNKRNVFSHNSINSLIKAYRSFEIKKPFQKGMLLRLYVFIAVEVILVILAGISFIMLMLSYIDETFYLFTFLLLLALGVYLIYRYIRRYKKTVTDIGKLIDQIEVIKNGDIKNRLILAPGADMYNAAQSLNKIQEGINKAVEDRIKSERTKVELITNVSHD